MASGYAVFPDAGGGDGKGIAFDSLARGETAMRATRATPAARARYDLVWIFGTVPAFRQFLEQGYAFSEQAPAAARAGDLGGVLSGAFQVAPDVWVYRLDETGLAPELGLDGTRYQRDDSTH